MWSDGQVVRGVIAWRRKKIVCSNFGWYIFFRGKFTSVCGKNSLDSRSHRKIPADTPEKNTLRLFAEVPRLTTSIWRNIRGNLKQCGLILCGIIYCRPVLMLHRICFLNIYEWQRLYEYPTSILPAEEGYGLKFWHFPG